MSSMSRSDRRKEKFAKIKHPPKPEEKMKWSDNSILLISSAVISFLFIMAIGTFNTEITNFFNPRDEAHDRTTNATVYSYETETMLDQTRIGNISRIKDYLVRYRYKVNGRTYDHEEILSMWTKAAYLIYLEKNLNTESFLVQYDIANPEKVYLVQKE